MAFELERNTAYEFSFQLTLANPSAAATADLVTAQGGLGPLVPAGYEFDVIFASVESNADLTAGTATLKVTTDGTEVSNGPEPVLSDLVQKASAVVAPGSVTIAAGAQIGASITTTAAYLPTTADVSCFVSGQFIPIDV